MASLALSGLWAVVRGALVSAQERGGLSSVDERIKRLEQQLEELRRTLKIPGVSAAIIKDQKLTWAKGIGLADVENKIRFTIDQFKVFAIKSHVHLRRGLDDSGFAKTIVLVESEQPFLGTVRLEALPYRNVDISKFYPYGDVRLSLSERS